MKATKSIKATVVDITEFTVLIEFEDASKHLQRYHIHRELLPVSLKHQPVTVPEEFVTLGIPASNVDLVMSLGETLPTIQVRNLQDQLRRAGLWTREDYQNNPKIVQTVLAKMLRIEASVVLNAAARGKQEM